MTAAETPLFVWYLMRGSGLVALVLLSMTLALGVVGVRRWRSARWPRLLTAGLHRNVALLSVCFLAVHIITALLDTWIGLSWIGFFVPFTSTYRAIWVGLGVLAFDLLLAVVATSLLRRHLSFGAWRAVHWCTWALWPLAFFHAVGSGTDTGSPVGLVVCASSAALVALAALWRWRQPATGPARRTVAAASAPGPVPSPDRQPVGTQHR
jgi:methionine sulfoxide reductase heme-binding subunit